MNDVLDGRHIRIRNRSETKLSESRAATILGKAVQSVPDGIDIGTTVARPEAIRSSTDKVVSSAALQPTACETSVDDTATRYKLGVAHGEEQSHSLSQTCVPQHTPTSVRSASSRLNVVKAANESRRIGRQRKDDMDEIFGF